MIVKALLYLYLVVGAMGQYGDRRCRCVCPSPAAVSKESTKLTFKQFIADVPPSQCNCVGVVIPRVPNEMKGRQAEYCLRCECKFETRNTGVIKVTVISLLWVMSLLLVYCCFLMCLDPLMRNQRAQHYRERTSDEAQFLMIDSDEEVYGPAT